MRHPTLKSSLAQAVEQDEPAVFIHPTRSPEHEAGMVEFEVSQRLLINIPWLLGLYMEFWPALSLISSKFSLFYLGPDSRVCLWSLGISAACLA